MSTPHLHRSQVESVLQLLFKFLDLSQDVERNVEDSLFREDGGTISYVLDENVFEIFVRPWDPRGQGASLHSSHWTAAYSEARHSGLEKSSVPAQTALLTSEYLLSGDLPGQRDSRVYMTEWHRWELARRYRELSDEYGRALARTSEEELSNRFDPLLTFFKSMKDGDDPDGLTEALVPGLRKDVEALKESGAPPEVVRTFISTRFVVQFLGEDDRIEPAEQLLRTVRDPLRQRIATLHLAYRPSEADRKFIKADAARWFDLLLHECAERGVRLLEAGEAGREHRKGDRSRTRAALWDDARSLALIRWAAVRAVGLQEKLVFVTADSIVFDTYRKWYVDLQPGTPEYLEPFVLRRLLQYAPIFNLADSRNVLGEMT
jgi:hypothetical protein